MSTDPREALDAFLEAVREHFAASAQRSGDQDPRVEAAYMALADAFEIYEDSIYTAFDEVTPFELFDDVEDARDDSEDADDTDDGDDFDDIEEDELDIELEPDEVIRRDQEI